MRNLRPSATRPPRVSNLPRALCNLRPSATRQQPAVSYPPSARQQPLPVSYPSATYLLIYLSTPHPLRLCSGQLPPARHLPALRSSATSAGSATSARQILAVCVSRTCARQILFIYLSTPSCPRVRPLPVSNLRPSATRPEGIEVPRIWRAPKFQPNKARKPKNIQKQEARV